MKQLLFFIIMIGMMQAVDAQTKPNPLTTGKAKPPAETIKVTPVTKPVATVKGRLPDLSVTLNSCNYNPGLGMYEIIYTVKNNGYAPVPVNQISLSGKIHLTNGAFYKGGCGASLASGSATEGQVLNAGEERNGSFRCSAPLYTGNSYVYRLTVDEENRIKEGNEANNVSEKPMAGNTSTAPAVEQFPDLTVSITGTSFGSITTNSNGSKNARLIISYTVSNRGTASVRASQIILSNFYGQKPDNSPGWCESALTSDQQTQLAPGVSMNGQLVCNVNNIGRTSAAVGYQVSIKLMVNYGVTIRESDYGNNEVLIKNIKFSD